MRRAETVEPINMTDQPRPSASCNSHEGTNPTSHNLDASLPLAGKISTLLIRSSHDGTSRNLTIARIMDPESEPEILDPAQHDSKFPLITTDHLMLRVKAAVAAPGVAIGNVTSTCLDVVKLPHPPSDLNVVGLVDLLPNRREDKELEKSICLFIKLDSLTKALQREDLTCANVRVPFDGTISEYSKAASRLSSTGKIIISKAFESSIVKIQNNFAREPADDKKSSIMDLNVTSDDPEDSLYSVVLSLAERVLKRRNLMPNNSACFGTRFLLPFSKTGYASSSRRKAISHEKFEKKLFLQANREFRNITDLGAILESEKYN